VPVLAEAVVVPDREGAGTDEAHVALYNVDELRELVNAELPQDASDRRSSRIIFDLDDRAASLVQTLQFLLLLFSAVYHGAKFVQVEPSLVEAHPFLDK
jgi:hypothetical protein